MKYLRQENNRFIFEDGGEELELIYNEKDWVYDFPKGDLNIEIAGEEFSIQPIRYCNILYSRAQTAAQMMTILKEKGLV